MAYLLIIPISIYIVLATLILQRQRNSLPHIVLALYIAAAALVTAGYVVLGTTTDQFTAYSASILVVFSSSILYLALMPLALLSLYFESWLVIHRKSVLTLAVVSQILVLTGAMVLYALRPFPLAVYVDGSYWRQWMLLEADINPPLAIFETVITPVASLIVIGAAIHLQRIQFWRSAIVLTIMNVLSVITVFLAPLAGGEFPPIIAALALFPLVLVHASMMLQATRLKSLDTLITSTFQRYNEGLVVIDALDRVIWHNAQAKQWFPWPPSNFAPQPVAEVLHGTLLLAPVRHLLSGEDLSTRAEWMEGNREISLHLELHPLDFVRYLPHARLLIIRSVTTPHQLLSQQAQRTEMLALSAISADIASSLDMDQVITRALQHTQNVVRADTAVVYLIDQENPHRLVRTGQIMRNTDQSPPMIVPAHLSLADTTAGWVVRNAKPVFESTSYTHVEREAPSHLAERGLQAGATVPLMTRDRVIGVLQMGMLHAYTFDPVTIALIESVGRQLGIAIDNARLHNEERHQRQVAEVLSSLAGILTTKSLDQALQALLDQFRNLVDYSRASILLLKEEGTLGISAHAGFKDVQPGEVMDHVTIDIAEFPLLQAALKKRQPQLVTNTFTDPRWTPGDFIMGSWIGAPLIIHDQVLGCLSVAHAQPGYFSQRHLHLAATFADQAVIAVENARLFEAEQNQRKLAEFLQRASYDLVTSPDLDSALLTALTHLSKVLDFDQARIGLIDSTRDVWTIRVNYPSESTIQHNKTISIDFFPLVRRLVEERTPIYVADTRENPLWIPDPPEKPEIRCWIGVPLIARDNLIGLLNFYSYQPRTLTREHLHFAQLFANQAAAAFENFRLLEEAEHQNQSLRGLNTVLAASNEALAARENVLGVSLARVLDTLRLSGGAIHQLEPNEHWLRLQTAAGLPDDVVRHLHRVPLHDSIEPMRLPSIMVNDETTSFFSVPLIANAREIGLLSIVWPEQQPVHNQLRTLLSSIGQQLGVVMENATLFEATQRRAALSTDLNRLSLAISAQLDRDTVLELLCNESVGVFNVQGAYIWLVDDDDIVGVAASGPGQSQFIGHRIAMKNKHLLPAQVLTQWRPQYAHYINIKSAVLPDDFLALVPVKSALAVPLLKADVPLGVLMLINTELPDAFSNWPLEQIGVLGVQATLAIQNAMLYQEAKHRLDQLQLVNTTTRYATAILSPGPLIEGVTQKIAQTLGYDLVSLIETTPEDLVIQTVYFRDEALSEQEIAPLRGIFLMHAERAIVSAAPVQENVAYAALRALKDSGRDATAPEGFCALAVPLIIADEVTGVLLAAREAEDSITSEDMDVLQPLASQLAISVSNARLYEKVRQQTIALEARVAHRTEEIRRQQERTEAILRSVADAVIVLDKEAKVIMTNPVARAVFDKHDLEMDLGTRVRELVAPILNDSDANHDPTDIFEAGSVTLQAKAAPVMDADQMVGVVVILRDITQLSELDRMKDMFVSNVSHELRTPMANLKLYLSLLEQGRPERRDKYREVMKREVERLERLIGDLLQISRLKGEQTSTRVQVREQLNLEQLINNVIEGNLALAQNEHKTLIHECKRSPLPATNGDPDQIIRALTNLVSNALRYTPAEGSVTVRSFTAGQTNPEWVIIEVVDTGIGIPDHELPSIFDRFYRGSNISPTISGTGLGLAIVKEILELHGGYIEVESSEGQGSTFRMRLPVSEKTATDKTLVEIG